RRHAYPEAMCFVAPTGIGLVGALPLHGVLVSASRLWRSVNTSRRLKRVSTKDQIPLACATFPDFDFAFGQPLSPEPFGFFPKISTTVENTVENIDARLSCRGSTGFPAQFPSRRR